MDIKLLYSGIFTIFAAAVITVTGMSALQDVPQSMMQSSLFSSTQKKEEFKLTQEQLADLTKPSVVRVYQSVKVTGEVPAFLIDFNTKSAKFLPDKEPLPLDLEMPAYGSGFVVNPDGYIVTNAHVVTITDEEVEYYVLATLINRIALVEYAYMEQGQLASLLTDKQAMEDLGKNVYNQVKEKSIFNIDRKITVINPSSKADNIDDLVKDGFPATVVKSNDKYEDDGRDAAIIKIDENNLPAIKLAANPNYSVGSKIFIFGFPSTAEFNLKSFIEPTFSQGAVNATKQSDKGDFKLIQFDAKVSEGSSGSPMIDGDGSAIGIVTYQLGDEEGSSGDSFAFAIPINIGQDLLDEAVVKANPGNYSIHLKAGLALAQDKRCKRAIEEFDLAKNTNSNFSADAYIDPYIENCKSLIAKGESIDSKWDEFKQWVKNIGLLGWAIIGGGTVLFIILVIFVVFLAKKMKGKEKEINKLEDMMLEEAARENVQREEMQKILKSNGQNGVVGGVAAEAADNEITGEQNKAVVNPVIQEEVGKMPVAAVDPGVAAYVKQSREAGFDDAAIAAELKKSGWNDIDIQNALAIK